MSGREILLIILFSFMPAAGSLPGRAYYKITGMNRIVEMSAGHALVTPSILLGVGIALFRLFERRRGGSVDGWARLAAVALVLFFAAGTVASLANWESTLVPVCYVAGPLSGFITYLALRDVELSARAMDRLVLAMAFGSAWPLLLGAYGYYDAFGLPDLQGLLVNHFNIPGMQSYEYLTFGNLGNMAAFLMLVGPVFAAVALDKSRNGKVRGCSTLCATLAGAHMLVIQSRAGLIATAAVALLLMSFYRNRGLVIVPILLVLVIVPAAVESSDPQAWSLFTQRFGAVARADTIGDSSVRARRDSIEDGWKILRANWRTGIGPGAQYLYVNQGAAHQFHVEQGVELGLLGLIASVLLTVSVMMRAGRLIGAGPSIDANRARFALLVGPVGYLFYATLAGAPLMIGNVNTWIVLLIGLVALTECPWTATSKARRGASGWGRLSRDAGRGANSGVRLKRPAHGAS